MKRLIFIALAALSLSTHANERAVTLEARLKETVDGTEPNAEIMLELIDIYSKEEQVFGLIRTASRFSRTQNEHAKRPEVILKLMDGYAIAARHSDVIATGRQFLEKYPNDELANKVREHLATSLEVTGALLSAAEIRADMWRNGGEDKDGVRALQLFSKVENITSARGATALTVEMSNKMPANERLTPVALKGLEMVGRCEQWSDGLQVVKNVLRRGPPMKDSQRRSLHHRAGQFESRLGQHSNAVESFTKAMDKGRDYSHRDLVYSMLAAKKPLSEAEKQARAYSEIYSYRDDRYDPLAAVANAYKEADKLSEALRLAVEIISNDVHVRDMPRVFVEWCGDDHSKAEQGLIKAIGKSPRDSWKLRSHLIFSVYRDRMKNEDKARQAAREYLLKSPTGHETSEWVAAYLLNSAPDEKTFKADIDAIEKSARTYPQIEGYTDRLWNGRPKDNNRARIWDLAKKSFYNDPIVRLWRQTHDKGGKGAQGCKGLLDKDPSPEHREWLMRRQAYLYRHHLGGGSRRTSARQYQKLCEAYPEDFSYAESWLEAADYAEREKEEQRLAAAKHLLSLKPQAAHHDTWKRIMETRNEDIVRKAIPWISKSAGLSKHPVYHATYIGDVLWQMELKKEALEWWRSRMDVEPDHGECVSCAEKVASQMQPEEAISFLGKRFEKSDHHQGRYAARIAHLAINFGNLEMMEAILKTSKSRALNNPYDGWTLGEWLPREWINNAQTKDKWSEEQTARILKVVKDLEYGNVSAEAALILAKDADRNIERLLEAQSFIARSGQHHESWSRIFPHAQASMAREDYTLASTILNGLLHTIRSVGGKEMDQARTLLRRAYGVLGSASSDIPADSPIAPLLQIIVHLRLGENDLAEESYYENRKLFDQHRDDLPIELILFGAETHINQGTEEDLMRAEDILAGWKIAFSESDAVDIRDKARVQLLLARKYQRARQFDAARLEFTSVLNNYGDQPEAMQARFGIGETFMSQRIFDKAEEVFAELAESSDPRITIRADFLRGVLAIRQGENEQARRIFLEVLGRLPDAQLANETLFHLAEVYGLEQRYLTQLETLRTVGRLGRESKRWHTPGNALSVVVQDTDLGISRGETRIPVIVRTEPGGDMEASFLASGGAGKGIFLSEIPTELGEAIPEDGTIQVTGGDVIVVDYPEDFKNEFQFEFLSSTRLRIASDGSLEVASSEIIDSDDKTFTEALKEQNDALNEPQTKSATRPKNQVKPGNLIYARVKDGDQDISTKPDKVPVKMEASSGDVVITELLENDIHGGSFTGSVRTGELPAGAQASDSALDHNALMAIDHSMETIWRSEPDGAAPKSLSIDMKEVRPVDSIIYTSPDAENEAPIRMHIRGSHDGRFWYTLANFPTPEPALRPELKDTKMRALIYKFPADQLKESYSWKEIVELIENKEASETLDELESLAWAPPAEGNQAYLIIWAGCFAQERDGGMRLSITGENNALMVDGRLEVAPSNETGTCDIYAKAGLHELIAFSTTKDGGSTVGVTRARENTQSAQVSLSSFKPSDFEFNEMELVDGPVEGSMEQKDNTWILSLPSHDLRFVENNILEYRGEAVSISNVEISGGDTRHVPPVDDVLELAKNDILELAPGDTVTVSYLDELTAENHQPNRFLTAELKATYYNGKITPIGYDFARTSGGSVSGARKELLRIEPGDRIVAEVIDYDLDVNPEKDEVEIEVQVGAQPAITMTATETEASSGVFLCEIETSAEPEEGKITVKQGDKVYLRYKDDQNIFPGNSTFRETVVFLNEPTDGKIQIVDSGKPFDGTLNYTPVPDDRDADFVSKVDYHLPLTIEVIDPDQAMNTSSTVLVDVETTQGTRIRVQCVLSRRFATPSDVLDEANNPALFEGRFVGQIPILLGGPESASIVPADGTIALGGMGRLIPIIPDDSPDLKLSGMPVLNVNGKDTFTASYQDASRPASEAKGLTAKAELFTAATLQITDEEYLEDAEIAHVGKKIYLRLEDPDLDISSKRDKAILRISTESGEAETIEIEETLSHSGVFSGSFPLKSTAQPTKDNSQGEIECFFGDTITVGYLDNVPQRADGEPIIELTLPVAVGTDGEVGVFSKVFKDEDLAVQTRFHVAESYFELFKSHLKLERKEEAMADLASGRRVLRELREDHPDPKYAPRIAYLLGQFAQEMKSWDEAIDAYRLIVSNHPEHKLAPDAQYKLGQCYEEAGQLDEALESYVTLAATYPKSPLIANVMLRINEHFYKKEDYSVAASVGSKFLERFPNHEWAPRMAFRIGQCYYKEDNFTKAGSAFDSFVKRFPDEELTAQALFWSGESYRMAKNVPEAFRRYNRCRWDFPESDAAKYSRGRLALPEMLAQFEREANLTEE